MVTGVQFVECVTAKIAQITRAGLLQFSLFQILFAGFFLIMTNTPAFSEGRIYEGSEEKAHCTLWDTQVMPLLVKVLKISI